MSIHHLIVTYGYLAVFLLVAVESFGVPLPGETAVIVAATYAGATHNLSVWVIFLLAALGAVLGDTGGYWIGNKGGYRLLRRWGHYVRFDEPKLKVARYLFERHGGKVVFFGRFVSILRTYAAFLAGTARMRYGRFLTWNASGGSCGPPSTPLAPTSPAPPWPPPRRRWPSPWAWPPWWSSWWRCSWSAARRAS